MAKTLTKLDQPTLTHSPIDPERLLLTAIEKGLQTDTIERLLAMRRELQAEAAERAYWTAMLEFQAQCPDIPKSKPVHDKNGKFLYRYAPIEDIRKVTDPLAAKLGFVITANTKHAQTGVTVVITCAHIAGHKEVSEFHIPPNKAPLQTDQQAAEGAVTFALRVAYRNVFGITTGMNDDNTEGQKTEVTDTRERFKRTANPPQGNDLPNDATIGNNSMKRKIEATIGQFKIDRDYVKSFMGKRTGKSHFADLTYNEAERLIDVIPRLAANLMLKDAFTCDWDKLERLGAEPPTWFNREETEELLAIVDDRLKRRAEETQQQTLLEVQDVPPGPDSAPPARPV